MSRVGSGKSTLLKAILGELEHISGSRQMRRGLKVAFCDQEPWLLDQSLKENIVGSRPFDPEWYERVIDACALAQDITGFSEGDAAPVGSGGSALSGGQKSRVVSVLEPDEPPFSCWVIFLAWLVINSHRHSLAPFIASRNYFSWMTFSAVLTGNQRRTFFPRSSQRMVYWPN